jgi:hypothetical protein
VTHAESNRRRYGVPGRRHAGARRTERGSDQGFKFGGWVMPYFDDEFGEELNRLFSEKFDLLLGRKTYEIFAAYWPYYDENAPDGGIAKLFNKITKYAVSRSNEVDTSLARLGAPSRHCRREASEARGRPEPRHTGQYRTRACDCSPTIWSMR